MAEPPGETPFVERFLRRLFLHPTDATTTLIWAGVSGLVAGLAAILYHEAFALLTRAAFWLTGTAAPPDAGAELLASPEAGLAWFERLLLPAAGAALAGILLTRFRRQARRGPAEILEAVAITDGRIPTRPSILKAAASLLTISAGGSIGREGPMIQLGAMATSQLGQRLGFAPARLRILAGCGAAAGFAVAFHATIGGALFVMEVIFGNFAAELFGPLVLASVLATLLARGLYGSEPIFAVPEFTSHPSEVPLYIFVGVFAGVVSPLFMKWLWGFEGWYKRKVPALWLRLPLAGLAVGAAGIWWPQVWGNGAETIRTITRGGIPWEVLLVLLFLKPFVTACMVGSGAPGGVFTPTLLLGACSGGLLGEVFSRFWPWPHGNPTDYALIGMGAVLAGTTHAPLTAIFILFEMVLDYDMVLPLMLSCSLASILSRRFHPDSIYSEPLSRQGIRTSKIPEASLFSTTLVSEVMRPVGPHDAVLPTAGFAEIADAFMNTTHKHLYVADAKNRFRGAIRLHDFKTVYHAEHDLKFLIAEDLLQTDFPTAAPGDRLSHILDRFLAEDCERIPVVDGGREKRLVGTISRRDILDLYNREALGRRTLMSRAVLGGDRADDTLLSLYRVETIPVPPAWTGRTLADLRLPERFGVTVLAVETSGGAAKIQRLPNPQEPLAPEALLVVLGTLDQIRRAQDGRAAE